MDTARLGKLDISYEPAADVLYCSFGEPREAIGTEVEDGVMVRSDPETREVVGITVIDFSRRFTLQPAKVVSVPLDAIGSAA